MSQFMIRIDLHLIASHYTYSKSYYKRLPFITCITHIPHICYATRSTAGCSSEKLAVPAYGQPAPLRLRN